MKKALLLFVAVSAVFALGVTGGHLRLDDWGYTYGCAFVKSGLSVKNLLAALTSFNGGIWMPLTYVTYMLDISCFGGGWPVHHAVNVFWHAVNAVLVFLFLRRLVASLMVAPCQVGAFPRNAHKDHAPKGLDLACFAAALVWAVHPMKVEAVVWVASRKELLWTFFALLGSFSWLRFAEKGGCRRYFMALAAFLAACLAKPTAVCLPLLWILFGRMLVGPGRRDRWFHYLPMLLVSLLVGLVAYASQLMPSTGETVSVFETSFGWRLLNAAVSLGLLVAHTFAPVGVHLDYRAAFGGWPRGGWLGLAVLAVSVAVVGFAALKARSHAVRRAAAFGAAWFLIGLLPVIGIFGTAGDKAYADRYAYLPSLAFALALALALMALVRCGCGRYAAAASVAVTAGLLAATIPLIATFRDDFTLYRRVLALDPDHWRAQRIVGCQYCATENRMEEGLALLRRSLRARPSKQTADSLAYVLACRGTPADCAEVRRLGASVAAKPSTDRGGLMLDAIGIVSMRQGDDAAAVRSFSTALVAPERSHGNLHSMLNLALALANVGKDRDALELLKKLENVGHDRIREAARAARATITTGGPRRRFEVVIR